MDDECLPDMIEFKEYPILLTPTLYNLVQETIDDKINIERQQQFEQINNNSSSSPNCDITHMDLDDFFFKESEQIMSHNNTTTNDGQFIISMSHCFVFITTIFFLDNTTHQEQMSQPITTTGKYFFTFSYTFFNARWR
jgi:hypothetical protein